MGVTVTIDVDMLGHANITHFAMIVTAGISMVVTTGIAVVVTAGIAVVVTAGIAVVVTAGISTIVTAGISVVIRLPMIVALLVANVAMISRAVVMTNLNLSIGVVMIVRASAVG